MIMPGVETDFIIWGYEGVYTYHLGDKEAVACVRAYEAPCQWEGCKAAVLKDGRTVFAQTTDINKEETILGTAYRWKPETTTFYYVSTVK